MVADKNKNRTIDPFTTLSTLNKPAPVESIPGKALVMTQHKQKGLSN
jgi:hypothetical protein